MNTDIRRIVPASEIMHMAYYEAREWKSKYVGTEYILLAILEHGRNLATSMLGEFGIDQIMIVKALVDQGLKQGERLYSPSENRIPFTPRSYKIVALARKKARQLGHSESGCIHLLLAFFIEMDSVAYRALFSLG